MRCHQKRDLRATSQLWWGRGRGEGGCGGWWGHPLGGNHTKYTQPRFKGGVGAARPRPGDAAHPHQSPPPGLPFEIADVGKKKRCLLFPIAKSLFLSRRRQQKVAPGAIPFPNLESIGSGNFGDGAIKIQQTVPQKYTSPSGRKGTLQILGPEIRPSPRT